MQGNSKCKANRYHQFVLKRNVTPTRNHRFHTAHVHEVVLKIFSFSQSPTLYSVFFVGEFYRKWTCFSSRSEKCDGKSKMAKKNFFNLWNSCLLYNYRFTLEIMLHGKYLNLNVIKKIKNDFHKLMENAGLRACVTDIRVLIDENSGKFINISLEMNKIFLKKYILKNFGEKSAQENFPHFSFSHNSVVNITKATFLHQEP